MSLDRLFYVAYAPVQQNKFCIKSSFFVVTLIVRNHQITKKCFELLYRHYPFSVYDKTKCNEHILRVTIVVRT